MLHNCNCCHRPTNIAGVWCLVINPDILTEPRTVLKGHNVRAKCPVAQEAGESLEVRGSGPWTSCNKKPNFPPTAGRNASRILLSCSQDPKGVPTTTETTTATTSRLHGKVSREVNLNITSPSQARCHRCLARRISSRPP